VPDYNQIAKTAYRLVSNAGLSCVVESKKARSVDKIEGTVVDGSITREDAKIVFLPASNGTIQNFEQRLKEDFVKGRARYAIMAAKDVTPPEISDEVVVGSDRYSVVGSTPLDPAGTPLIYPLGLRKI